MSRKADLEQYIRDAYEIIRKWEKRRLDADPTELARCEREIEEQWEKVRSWAVERSRLPGELPADVAEIVMAVEIRWPGSLAGPAEGKTLPAIAKPAHPFEPELVRIPAGEFLMGSNPKVNRDAPGNEQPQHRLYLPAYALGRTPVTNAQYAAFVQAAGCAPPDHWPGQGSPAGQEDHPVVNVTWHDAVAYCRWLTAVTGRPYDLPGEAEWEKGARGADGRIYPWGNTWDPQRCNSVETGPGATTPVGSYPQGASPYGLLDMAGNVWEWTRSLDRKYPYLADDGREDPDASGPRALRGGAFFNRQWFVRCAVRYWKPPSSRFNYLGFRVVSLPGQ
jgi:formylglycine-generating enzyme required for sulfatase activity